MGQQTEKFRLDEILIDMGLISEDQIKVALELQKIYGGRFGSLLLHKNFIDEAGLVKALSRQLGCHGVVLSKLKLDDVVYRMIPQRVALARKVIPFDYDIDNNVLKIACADPSEEGLENELGFFVRGKKIELFVAADIALNAALSKYYLGREISFQDSIKFEIPPEIFEQKKVKLKEKSMADIRISKYEKAVLIVTDDKKTAPLLKNIFDNDKYEVVITDSARNAIGMLDQMHFHSLFVKDTIPGNYIDLIERVRKKSPATLVRYYENISSLLINEDEIKSEAELLTKNLELFTSLLSSKTEQQNNHSGQVGQYVEKLCRELKIPEKDCLLITTAAYVHDISRYYYETQKIGQDRQEIAQSIKLLASINYSPVILEILRSVYIDLKGKYTKRMPIEVLGGNILTIADLFCELIPQTGRLSFDKFETIKEKLNSMSGKLFLPEVLDAFTNMIQNEILDYHSGDSSQVLVFAEDISISQPITNRLKNEGFRTITLDTKDKLIELFERSQPDIMVLVEPGTPDKILNFVDYLEKHNVSYDRIPTFLLTEAVCVPRLTNLLERGIEDIIPIAENNEMLITKIKKLEVQINHRRNQSLGGAGNSGAIGNIKDINLIDLIQAMGPSLKTAKIVVKTIEAQSGELIIYLKKGQICYAKLDDIEGVEAIYEGLSWKDGIWRSEPISENDIQNENVEIPNEAILMEGCRLIDENMAVNN